MLEIERITHEEAVRRSLRSSTRTAGLILGAHHGQILNIEVTFTISVPANFAKAVLADYIKEQEGKPHDD